MEKPDQPTLKIKCPACGIHLLWDSSNRFRPFCSEQCKNQDFVSWANEEHHIPGSGDYDDLLSGDLEP